MNITFDAVKDAATIAKHGVSLADAAQSNWSWLLCHADARRDHGALREPASPEATGRGLV